MIYKIDIKEKFFVEKNKLAKLGFSVLTALVCRTFLNGKKIVSILDRERMKSN